MGGFNLPPGVSVNMIPGNRPEDELADMIADGWRMKCQNCGGFLRFEMDYKEDWEDAIMCSGKPTKYVHTYGEVEQDEAILRIIGEQYRGTTYNIYIYDCGIEGAGNPHKPHKEIFAEGWNEHRICRKCFFDNEESVM